MRILDLTPGKRGIWFDKNHPAVTWGDDVRGPYNLIVFDPTHENVGANSNMADDYGHHTASEIREFIYAQAYLAHSVGSADALMAFKWNDHGQRLEAALALMKKWWEPLFGQRVATRTARGNSTYWVMLLRRSET